MKPAYLKGIPVKSESRRDRVALRQSIATRCRKPSRNLRRPPERANGGGGGIAGGIATGQGRTTGRAETEFAGVAADAALISGNVGRGGWKAVQSQGFKAKPAGKSPLAIARSALLNKPGKARFKRSA